MKYLSKEPIYSKAPTPEYEESWDRIFKNKFIAGEKVHEGDAVVIGKDGKVYKYSLANVNKWSDAIVAGIPIRELKIEDLKK